MMIDPSNDAAQADKECQCTCCEEDRKFGDSIRAGSKSRGQYFLDCERARVAAGCRARQERIAAGERVFSQGRDASEKLLELKNKLIRELDLAKQASPSCEGDQLDVEE